MKKLFALLLLSFSAFAWSQGTGSIVGKLTDKDYNNEPLPFANVFIKGTSTGTTSDMDGLYELKDIEPGIYTVVFSFVGYETVEIPDVKVEANMATTVNVPLGASAATLDEVVIKTTTKRESEVALLLEQKKATTIQQSIGAEELSRKGVGDAASAVSKISGISGQQGGSNVYVRGLGDRYLNTTYNGLSLPSNDIEKKNMDLGLFSSDIIQNIGVSKAYASTFYGDFAAGNVNIVSKEHSGKFFLDIDLGASLNTNASGKDFVRSEGSGFFGFYNRYEHNPFAIILSHGIDPVDAGNPIGINGSLAGGTSINFEDSSKLSFFYTASFSSNYEYREGEQVDFTTVEKKRFPNTTEFEYGTNTTAMLNIGYKNGDHDLRFNSLFINDATSEVGYYGTKGLGTNRDAILDTDKGFYQMNSQFDQNMVFVNQLLGAHNFEEKFKLDWGVGYNKVFAHQPDRRRISVERYDLAFDNDPTTQPSFFNNIPFDNQRYFQNIEDEELNSRINIEYTASENFKLNFGYNGRYKERFFDNIRYGYDFIQPNTPVNDVFNLDEVFDVSNLGVVWNTYVFNPIWPEGGIDQTNYPGLSENTYTGNLKVHGVYLNAEINVANFTFVPGMRVESFDQRIKYNVINLPPDEVGFRSAYENFYLPSLNIKYALNDDMNLRFAASNTVSFPEFKEVAPFVYEDVTQRIGGNPDLLNDPSFSNIYNIDLKYEWFFGNGEILSIAGFAKRIEDPVNKVIANDATGTQRYFRTGEKAEVIGAEVEVRKSLLTKDEEPVLSVGANVTYMNTKQDLRDSNGLYSTTFNRAEDELQGASPLLINADLSYSPQFGNYKPMANIVFSYFSDRIDALGSGQLGNIIEKSVPTLDFVWKNSIGEHLEVNASAKNLLDPSIERIRENTSLGDVVISEYTRGITLGLQLKYKF